MDIVAIDLGKRKSYVVVESDGKVTEEGYAATSSEGINAYIGKLTDPTIVLEASSTLERAVSLLDEHRSRIRVAHPMKVKLITASIKKTDKNDAHILLDLYKAGYLPESYLPPAEVTRARNLCRSRQFLIRNRTATKNRIRDQAYRIGIDFKYFTKVEMKRLSSATPILQILIDELKNTNEQVGRLDRLISEEVCGNECAKLIDTIPGIGKYGALAIASEIGEIGRFPCEENLFSYAGLVPRIHQSGSQEWKGHITKGNGFLKYILVECVQIHMNRRPESRITFAYEGIRERAGNGKARIAAARRLLRTIYYMLKRNLDYDSYEQGRMARCANAAALQRI